MLKVEGIKQKYKGDNYDDCGFILLVQASGEEAANGANEKLTTSSAPTTRSGTRSSTTPLPQQRGGGRRYPRRPLRPQPRSACQVRPPVPQQDGEAPPSNPHKP